jgi:hypothetical protein
MKVPENPGIAPLSFTAICGGKCKYCVIGNFCFLLNDFQCVLIDGGLIFGGGPGAGEALC